MPAGIPEIALPAFQYWMNRSAQLRWSIPAEAAGPVNGPVTPIVAFVHDGPAATRCGLAGFRDGNRCRRGCDPEDDDHAQDRS